MKNQRNSGLKKREKTTWLQ